jgi:hypothetical protein
MLRELLLGAIKSWKSLRMSKRGVGLALKLYVMYRQCLTSCDAYAPKDFRVKEHFKLLNCFISNSSKMINYNGPSYSLLYTQHGSSYGRQALLLALDKINYK